MKYICKFCQTEYTLTPGQHGAVQCVICGYVATINKNKSKSPILVFIAALCALLSAIIFTVVVITNQKVNDIKKNPLVVQIMDTTKVLNSDKKYNFVVSGQVTNRSDQIYGLPDLIIICLDKDGNQIAKQKFMPTATLLESKNSVKFKHVLSCSTDDVVKITAELKK
jgi:hypothetical protein